MGDSLVPEKIIKNILSRLPAESVLECNLVCKTWIYLIYNDKSFAQMHSRRIYDHDSVAAVSSGKASFIQLNKSAAKLKLLEHVKYDEDNYTKPLNSETIDLVPPYDCHDIVGSCNGLICISVIIGENIKDPVYICNPVTKEYAFLPNLRDLRGYGFRSEDYVVSGFGYHPLTNEYKVVRIYYPVNRSYWTPHWNEPLVGRVDVYTLGSGSGWRKLENIDYELYPSVSSEILADGALHWLDKQGNVVAFDLADEKFHILPKPKITAEMWNRNILEKGSCARHWDYELRVLGGCLRIIDRVSSKTRYPIWSFKKRDDLLNESIKKRKRLPDHDDDNAEQEEHYKLSWIWKDDSAFDWSALNSYRRTRSTFPFAILKEGTRILYHNACDTYLRQDLGGHNYQHITDNHSLDNLIWYVKSFVSLKAIGEKDAKIIKPSEGAKEQQRADLDRQDGFSSGYDTY